MARRRPRNPRRLGEEPAPPSPASAPTSSSTAETSPDGRGRVGGGGCLQCFWESLKKWAFGRCTSLAAPRGAIDSATAAAGRAHNAWKYDTRRKKKKPENDQRQDDDQLEGGEEPQQQQDQVISPYMNRALYEEYATIRRTLGAKNEIYHVCFFEGAPKRPWDGRVRQSEMITHFYNVHGISGLRCTEPECNVTFRSGEEQQLHVQFSQEILMRDPSLRRSRFCLGQPE